jgi:Mg-chelatase subunit ChlI
MDEEVKNQTVEERIHELEKAIKQSKSPVHIRKIVKGKVKNAARLEKLLDQAWEQIPEDEILRAYDNGGGQKGVQKSPAIKAYEDLLRSYNDAIDTVIDSLPKDSKEPIKRQARKKKPQNMLEQIREKQKDNL